MNKSPMVAVATGAVLVFGASSAAATELPPEPIDMLEVHEEAAPLDDAASTVETVVPDTAGEATDGEWTTSEGAGPEAIARATEVLPGPEAQNSLAEAPAGPFVSVDPIATGQNATVALTGFAPDSAVNIVVFVSNASRTFTATTDASGAASVQIPTRYFTSGVYQVQVADAKGTQATGYLTVVDGNPKPAEIPAISPTGQGNDAFLSAVYFRPGSVVTFTVAGVQVSGTVDPLGYVAVTLPTTGIAPGTHTVTATNGEDTATGNLTVVADPAVFPDPPAIVMPPAPDIYQGSIVSLGGSQFRPNSAVTFTVEGTDVTTTVASDADGSVWVTLQTQNLPPGQYTVVATDGDSRGTQTLNVLPWSVNPQVMVPPSVGVGGTLPVTVTGYEPNREVTITVGNAAGVLSTATALTDRQGNAQVDVSTEGLVAGTYTVTVTDGILDAQTQFTVKDATTPVVPGPITPDPVIPGTNITVDGNGNVIGTGGVTITGNHSFTGTTIDGDGNTVTSVTGSGEGNSSTVITGDGNTVTTTGTGTAVVDGRGNVVVTGDGMVVSPGTSTSSGETATGGTTPGRAVSPGAAASGQPAASDLGAPGPATAAQATRSGAPAATTSTTSGRGVQDMDTVLLGLGMSAAVAGAGVATVVVRRRKA